MNYKEKAYKELLAGTVKGKPYYKSICENEYVGE